jgi:RNA polymerase sigma-70 factor (ECF subfamily)
MNSSPDTRYTLIGKLQDPRDAEAWSEFSTIYQPIIFRIARTRGLQHADATDVTQEVLARVAVAIEKFDGNQPGATFRGWLYRMTRNLVVDHLRARNRDPIAGAADHVDHAPATDPSRDESTEFHREYQRQIFVIAAEVVRQQVQPQTWQAFWLTEVDRVPVADVAKQLGLSTGAIYVARSRVLARLKIVAETHVQEN